MPATSKAQKFESSKSFTDFEPDLSSLTADLWTQDAQAAHHNLNFIKATSADLPQLHLTSNEKPAEHNTAENNWELLHQYLDGTGADIQEHASHGDPILEQFMHSPGAQTMRAQYAKLGHPAFTDKLSYGTVQAWVDTVLKPLSDSASDGFKNLLDDHHLGNVAAQVGGFGNPPKEYPWANAIARRCNADGRAEPAGDHVQYQIINIAGLHSWSLHIGTDRPLGSKGPHRSIIQIFRWTEPLSSKDL